jgi:hypothetical protein
MVENKGTMGFAVVMRRFSGLLHYTLPAIAMEAFASETSKCIYDFRAVSSAPLLPLAGKTDSETVRGRT